jgi:adenine-specific DNA glycosylase
VPRYVEWLERWPTAEALAAASPRDVIRAWQGLGYKPPRPQPPPGQREQDRK